MRITPPNTWSNPAKHFTSAIEHPWYKLVFDLKAEIYFQTFQFYRSKNICPALLPITCGEVSSPMGLGSDSIPVKVDLFGEKTYLADSMQFFLEYMLRQGREGVFYIMGTFRGEDCDERHLNQFFHSEAEIVGDLNDVMVLVEQYLTHITGSIADLLGKSKFSEQVELGHIEKFLKQKEIPKIRYSDAIKLIGNKEIFYHEVEGGYKVISSVGEKELQRICGGFVWLTHHPAATVPFYQAVDSDGNALCADLLMGIGETVGCGQRHLDENKINKSLLDHKVNPAQYEWYLQMKKKYPLQTSGFGMGIERYLLWILNHKDIRDIPCINRLKNQFAYP